MRLPRPPLPQLVAILFGSPGPGHGSPHGGRGGAQLAAGGAVMGESEAPLTARTVAAAPPASSGRSGKRRARQPADTGDPDGNAIDAGAGSPPAPVEAPDDRSAVPAAVVTPVVAGLTDGQPAEGLPPDAGLAPDLADSDGAAKAAPPPRPAISRTGDPIIAMRHVSRRYGGPDGTSALEDANIAIWPGEFVVVLGPSGSGKTTLLNLIGGIDQATTGDIVATGHRISGATSGGLSRYRRESVSFIFQTFNLFPALSAIENVEFGAGVAHRSRPHDAAIAMLTEVGLGHRLRHFPHMLSGGEQQRVAIARALATGNRIVLADEPTGELDFRTGLQILELLQAQATTGRAVIVVTHNREIARIADRVIELSSGRIISDHTSEGPRPRLEDLHW